MGRKGIGALTRGGLPIAALVMAAAVIVTSCIGGQPSGEAGKPIKIGFLSPGSGTAAAPGQDMRDGFNFGLDKYGRSVAGHPIEVRFEDTAGDPNTALNKTRNLVDAQKVDILVGPLLASEGYAVRDYLVAQGTPTLFPIVSADDITQRKRADNIIRTGWSSSQPAHPFADYAAKTLGFKRMITFGADYAFGWEWVGGFTQTARENGISIVGHVWTPLGTPDFSAYLTRIPSDIDAVFALYFGADAVRFMKQFKELGYKGRVKLIGGGTLTDQSALRSMGDEALDTIAAYHYSDGLDTPANKQFVGDYLARYNKVPSYYSENTFTTARWIIQALKAVDGNVSDRDKLLKALRSVSFTDAPRGPVKLDKYNNPIQNIYVNQVKMVDGRLRNVPIYTYKDVSQFWNYKPEDYLKQPVYDRDHPPCCP